MKVAFDISALGIGHRHPSHRTGIYRVVDHVARGLIASPECSVSLVAGASFEVLRDSLAFVDSTPAFRRASMNHPRLLGLHVQLERASRAFKGGPAGSILSQPVAALRSLTGGASGSIDRRALSASDVYHSPMFPLQPCNGSVQRILTCYDLIPIKQPHLVLPSHRQFAKEILDSVRPSDWVICISEAVRNDVCEYLQRPPDRTFVTYLAADPTRFYREGDEALIDQVRSRYGIPPGPYFLGVATLEPRRNLHHLVASIATLFRDGQLPDLSMVLVGAQGWGISDLLETVGDEATRRRIIVTGHARDEDLAPLYTGAMAFVYPSLAEGFGLTPLEAMQCGVPVITSNSSSLPEVVGDAAIQVDPHDADALCESMLRVYRDANLRRQMSERSVSRARHFSWDKCVQETIGAYRTAIGNR